MAETVMQSLDRQRAEQKAKDDAAPVSRYSTIAISDRRYIVVEHDGYSTMRNGATLPFRTRMFKVVSEKPLSWVDAGTKLHQLQQLEAQEKQPLPKANGMPEA